MSIPLGVWLSPGATQRGLTYQRRVKAALDAVMPVMAQAVERQMRPGPDPMERFREVEQRLQPAAGRQGEEERAARRLGMVERQFERRFQPSVRRGPQPEPEPYQFPPVPVEMKGTAGTMDVMRHHATVRAQALLEPGEHITNLPLSYGELHEAGLPFGTTRRVTGQSLTPQEAWDIAVEELELSAHEQAALKQPLIGLRPGMAGLAGTAARGTLELPISPLAPPSLTEPIGEIPYIGPAAEREAKFLTSPVGLAATAIWPGFTAMGAAGGVAAGTTAQELGASEQEQLYAQIAGNILAPGAGLVPRGAVTRPAAAVGRAGLRRAEEMVPAARRLWAAEAGGPTVPGGRLRPTAPEGMRLINDIPATTEIRQRLAEIDAALAKKTVKGGRAAKLTERARLQAQADIDEILASGRPVEDQLDMLSRELTELQTEAQLRSVAFRGRWKMGKKFVPSEKEMRMGPPTAEELGARPSMARRREAGAAVAEQRYPGLSSAEVDARERVFREFVQNAKFEPVEVVVGEARPLVKVGEPTKVMGLDANVVEAQRIGGVDYELYGAAKLREDGGVVRVVDVDSGNVVTTKRYSTYEQAATEYRQAIKAVGQPAPEPLVGRGRFTAEGEVMAEPTYATEAELAGYRGEQARLPMGAGERPIETAGPMFERPQAAPAAAPRPGEALPVRPAEGVPPPREPPTRPPEPPAAGVPDESGHIPTLREVEADAFPKLTPEERARYVPERPGTYAPDDFEEVTTRILSGADETVMAFAEKLVRIPGVKQIVGAINRIAEARGNPILMARIKNGIFKAIEGNRADVSVLRWKKEMLDAFDWSSDWTATVSLRSGVKGVPKRATGHIEDLLAHTDDYILTDVQRAALDHGRGLRDNMLRQQLFNGVDVLPVRGEYMRRIVTATPEGKVRNGVVQRGGRIGGRKGSQKPRAFEDIRDGYRANYDYERDPFSLMGLRLREGVETIADKRTMRLVAAEGETVAERVPMHLREETVAARQKLVEARRVASKKGASVADKTAWDVARRDYVQTRRVWQEVRRRVGEPGWGEVRGPGNRIFDEQFAKELTEWSASGSESVVQQANLLVRAFKTTLDISATGVQMGLTALTHPLVWAKGTVRGIMSTLADPLTWAHANYEALDEAIKFGAAARPTEFMFARTGLSSIPLRIPYIGSLFRGSNRAFQWAIVQAQTDLWRIHRRGLTSTADLASAAASVRKQLGTLESAALGLGSKQRALESTVAFAARFLRANTGLLTDLGMRGPRGRIARETLGRFFVAGTTLTIGFNMAMNGGKLPNLTNPHEAGWFKVRLGKDSYVSVFGPFYPFMRLAAQDADLLAQGKITEVYKPLAWFIQSKAGIPFRTAHDLYLASRGQETNVFGDRLPTDPAGAAEFIARQFAPIGAEQAAEGVTEGRPEAGMEMVGINVTRVSAYRHLVEGWERERGNRDIPDVPFDEAGDPFKIAEQDPTLAPLVQEVYASGQRRGTPGAERAETIETARLGLEETALVKAAQDIEAGVPGARAEFAYSFEEYTTQTIGANEVVYQGMVRDPKSEEDKNLQAYYDIEKKDYPNPDGPGFDRDAFYAAKDAAFAKLTPQLQKAMENDIKSANEMVRQYEPDYRKARQIRSQAYDMPRHQGVSVEEEREARHFRSLVDQARDRIAGGGLEPGDVTIQQYLAVAEDNGVSAKMAYLAFALRPNSKGEVSLRDPRYTEFLIDNASVLAPYFPQFYPRRMLPALDPETKEEVIAAGVR